MNMMSISQLKGKRIRRILQTPWLGPVQIIDGLPDAFYCSVYIELDDLSVIHLGDDDISLAEDPPSGLSEISRPEHDIDPEIDYRSSGIKSVAENQLGEICLVLNNGVALYLQTGFGAYLSAMKISEILDNEIDAGVKEILTDKETGLPLRV